MNLLAIGLVLIGLGVTFLSTAPLIQQLALRMVGRPRNAIARWSRDVAASTMSLRSIRTTGVLCIIVGGAVLMLMGFGHR